MNFLLFILLFFVMMAFGIVASVLQGFRHLFRGSGRNERPRAEESSYSSTSSTRASSRMRPTSHHLDKSKAQDAEYEEIK